MEVVFFLLRYYYVVVVESLGYEGVYGVVFCDSQSVNFRVFIYFVLELFVHGCK